MQCPRRKQSSKIPDVRPNGRVATTFPLLIRMTDDVGFRRRRNSDAAVVIGGGDCRGGWATLSQRQHASRESFNA